MKLCFLTVEPAVLQAKRGGLKDTDAVDLLATVFKAVLDRTRINPADIGDIVVGSVLGPSSQRANEARIASFFAGIPEEVPVRTVNRCEQQLFQYSRCCHTLQVSMCVACMSGVRSCLQACGDVKLSATECRQNAAAC